MKPVRVGAYTLTHDTTRDLGCSPHRVESVIETYGRGNTAVLRLDLAAPEAARIGSTLSALGIFLDYLGTALMDCADADECERCGMPCDPGEADCPRCQDGAA